MLCCKPAVGALVGLSLATSQLCGLTRQVSVKEVELPAPLQEWSYPEAKRLQTKPPAIEKRFTFRTEKPYKAVIKFYLTKCFPNKPEDRESVLSTEDDFKNAGITFQKSVYDLSDEVYIPGQPDRVCTAKIESDIKGSNAVFTRREGKQTVKVFLAMKRNEATTHITLALTNR